MQSIEYQERPPAYDVAIVGKGKGEYLLILVLVVVLIMHLASGSSIQGSRIRDRSDETRDLDETNGTKLHTTQNSESIGVDAGLPPPAISNMPIKTVYNYVNPATGQVISSTLPPGHPEMVCLQHGHLPHMHYGILGNICEVSSFGMKFIERCPHRCACCSMLFPAWYRVVSVR